MIYNFSNIATILNGQIIVQQNNLAITEISIDTRKILNPYHSLFFAIKGIRNNGHQYIEDAYNKGIRNFVISEIVDFKRFSGCSVLLVNDSLKALQHLVAHHRSLFKIPIIGITGSNGKTII